MWKWLGGIAALTAVGGGAWWFLRPKTQAAQNVSVEEHTRRQVLADPRLAGMRQNTTQLRASAQAALGERMEAAGAFRPVRETRAAQDAASAQAELARVTGARAAAHVAALTRRHFGPI